MSPAQQDKFAQMYREAQVMVNEMKEKTWALEVARGKFYQLQIDMRSYVQMDMIPSDAAPQQVPRPEAVAAVSFAEPLTEIVQPRSTSASSTGAAPTSLNAAWLNGNAATRGPTRSRSLERRDKVPEPRETTVLPAYAGNAQVRETSSAPAVRFSQTAAPPPPPPPMRFEVEVQPPLALGIALKAKPSGGVMAGSTDLCPRVLWQ